MPWDAVSSDGVLLRPLLGDALRVRLVLLVVLRDVGREGVVRVRCAQERLHGEQHRADLERGRPLVLEDVEAYPAELVCAWAWMALTLVYMAARGM